MLVLTSVLCNPNKHRGGHSFTEQTDLGALLLVPHLMQQAPCVNRHRGHQDIGVVREKGLGLEFLFFF